MTIAPVQLRIVTGATDAPELASTLIASVFNTGIALGAWLGATSLANGMDLLRFPTFGAFAALSASAVALFALGWGRRISLRDKV